MKHAKASIVYLPHGGGPMPQLGEPNHAGLTQFLKSLGEQLPRPEAIVVISAHWEADTIRVSSHPSPELIFDYFGFPDEAY